MSRSVAPSLPLDGPLQLPTFPDTSADTLQGSSSTATPRPATLRRQDPSDYTLIMLGMAGTIFTPFDSLMDRLGVSPSAAVDLARNLHVHAVTSASRVFWPFAAAWITPRPTPLTFGQALSPPDPP